MGVDQSSQNIENNFCFLYKIEHKYFGEFNLVEDHKTKKKFIQKEILYYDIPSLEEDENNIKEKIQNKNENFLKIHASVLTKENNLCSNLYKLNYIVDYPFQDLSTELLKRSQENNFFNEDEIWKFIKILINSLHYLQNQNIVHSHLSCESIFFDEKNNLKLMHPDIIKQMPNFARVMISSERKGIYISPEEMKNLKNKKFDNKCNKFVSDSFVIGLIIVESINLKNCDFIYDFKNFTINLDEIKRILTKIKNKINKGIYELICGMLDLNEYTRPDFIKLKEMINKLDKERIKNEKIEKGENPLNEISKNFENITIVPANKDKSNDKLQSTFTTQKENITSNSFIKIRSPVKYEPFKENMEKENLNGTKEILNQTDRSNISLGMINSPKYAIPFILNKDNKIKDLNEIMNNDQESNIQEIININYYLKVEYIHEEYEDGSIYEGEKVGNLRHGRGRFSYADGGAYQGQWKQGRMDGFGSLFYPSGILAYQGEWKDDKFNGKGTVFNENPRNCKNYLDYKDIANFDEYWVKYEGYFFEDNKEGNGCLILSNGEKFNGIFINDMAEGEGIYTKINGENINGIWSLNKLISIIK